MSLKEAVSVFGPGLKSPTLDDIKRLREDLLGTSHGVFYAKRHDEIRQTSFGSRRFVITAGSGSQREYAGSDIHGCPALPQVVLQPLSHSRGNSKFRLFTTDGSRVLSIITTVDLDGRSSTIKWIKPDEETDDFLTISRQQTTVIVTALMLPASKLLERLEHARQILTHSLPSNPPSYPPSSPSDSGSLAVKRRRRRQKPYIPTHLRHDFASRRTSTMRWPFKISCFIVAVAIPVLVVFWYSAPNEVAGDRNRTNHATRSLAVERQRRRILTVRTSDFSHDVQYSTHWPPTTTEVEKLAEKTADFVTYAHSMQAMRVSFLAKDWLGLDLRADYFAVYNVITAHAAWIMENGDVPEIYRSLVSEAYATMGLMEDMESRILCYVGSDLARDSFEFYVRLLYHLEYAAHIIVLTQWDIKHSFDPIGILMRQATSFRLWLEERWVPSDDASCLKYALLHTPVNPGSLLSRLPLQNSLFFPYVADVKYVITSPPWR